MDYKLLPRFRGQVRRRRRSSFPLRSAIVPARILDIHVKPPLRSMNRFDIEVEGSHNYFVDGVMVHNSPETTTGGKALKFYASIRLDVRRIETLKDGTDAVGNRTKVKVVKNKMAPPFKSRRIRHPLRNRDQPGRQPDRPRRGAGHRAQVRRLVHLRGRPARPGQGERPHLPARQPGHGRRDREADQGEARRGPAARRGRHGQQARPRRHSSPRGRRQRVRHAADPHRPPGVTAGQ